MVSKKQIQKQLNNTIDTQTEFITLKKKDFEGKSNSEIQRKITQNAHKIWILLQANQFEYNATKKNCTVISRNNFLKIAFPTETKADHNNDPHN